MSAVPPSDDRDRAALLATAAKFLTSLHLACGSFKVTLTLPTGLEVRLRRRAGERTEEAAVEPDDAWLAFSPLEAKIIGGLREAGWLVTEELADKIGEKVTADLRAVLRNLQERRVVELCNRKGVRLNEGPLKGESEAQT